MNSKVQVISPNNLPANTGPTLTQTGDKNTQIARVDQLQLHNNVTLIMPNYIPGNHNLPTQKTFNTAYYNLFVIGIEDFNGRHFIIPKDRALTECITDELKSKYASLDDNAISEIIKIPAVFASENHHYGYTDENHLAYFGFVNDIKIQENGIKIYHNISFPIPQQVLNENAFDFAIKGASSFNELNRTHWTIKNINAVEELRNLGLAPF